MTGTPTASLDGPGQLDVEAVAGAVAVHRGEQDLARRRGARPRPPTPPRRARSGCGRRG